MKDLKSRHNDLVDENEMLHQWKQDNDIFISGLPESMNSETLTKNLSEVLSFSVESLNYHYSFAITDEKTKKKRHCAVVGFPNRQTKSEVIKKKIDMGPLLYGKLNPAASRENANEEIFISNRLTTANLRLHWQLRSLKKDGWIDKIIYKNCIFYAELSCNKKTYMIKNQDNLDVMMKDCPNYSKTAPNQPSNQPEHTNQFKKWVDKFRYNSIKNTTPGSSSSRMEH